MNVKDQLIRRIERLPEDVVEEVYDFVAFIQEKKRAGREGLSWGSFALGTGAFDFWNDREEVEYSLNDLRMEA